jgi:hypothetical protein
MFLSKSTSAIMKMLSRFFVLAVLARISYAFNLYPPVDPTKLATAYNISLDCLSALYVVVEVNYDALLTAEIATEQCWTVTKTSSQ